MSAGIRCATGLPTFPGIVPGSSRDSSPAQESAANRGGGVFKSTDSGASWNQVRASPVAAALAVDPRNPNTIYASTANGVAKSTDWGASWNTANAGLPAANCCASLALDPQNATLYVGFYYGGVYKSLDGGRSWTDTALPRWDDARTGAVVVDSENPSP